MAELIDGKALAAKLVARTAEAVAAMLADTGRAPGLAVVLVGDDPASDVYVRRKVAQCRKAGIRSIEHRLPDSTRQVDLLQLIDRLNADPDVHGILIQLPLPAGIDAGLVLDRIKVEVSRFNGREPDQHRWNIETGPLDSTSVRLSWNPTRTLSLQGSWGHFTDPEQLEPGVDQKRWSASALWADDLMPGPIA